MNFEIQRADFWKRISALLFDIIMLGIVVVGAAAAISAILKYDKYVNVAEQLETEIRTEQAAIYGVKPDMTEEEYNALTEEGKLQYELFKKAFTEAKDADSRLKTTYNIMMNIILVITSMSILIGYVVMELVVPIFFKNGQTLGKKAFGLAVVHTNGVRLHGQAHFIRTIIGKCLIETLVPVYIIFMVLFGNLGIVGGIVLLLIIALELFTVITTKTRSTIHDLVSDTVVVDMSSQMIFENADELVAYKTRIHEEMVNKQEY